MFIIIIVVIGIIIYLAKLQGRVTDLENKFKNINLHLHIKSSLEEKTEDIALPFESEVLKSDFTQKPKEIIQETFKEEIKPHQDNFAKNLSRVGIAILIIGVLFFLNYIDSQGLIGPVFKYVAGLLFGTVLLAIAEYLKQKNKTHVGYINLLRGGAFVIFFLTLFVEYMIFAIVSLPITLGLVVAVLAVSTIISIQENDALPFTLGTLGAYSVSFLIGLNIVGLSIDNIVGLMSYILILNIAIIFISIKKDWIASAIIGFIFTWSIFNSIFSVDISKGVLFIFASVYGLQYLIIFLMQDFQKLKIGNENKKIFNNTVVLTIINTIVYLLVFYALISETVLFDYVGYFVALLGIFHFIVYMFMRHITKSCNNIITLTHFVISVLIISASVSIQFDGALVTMIWFLEGVILSFLSVLKDFKNKSIMYILGFIAILAGIIHMLNFGVYDSVNDNGHIFLNQSYIVWFAVFILMNIVAYIWHNTVSDSDNIHFKEMIHKISFALIVVGQIMFIFLTSVEINDFGDYKINVINKGINIQMNLDRKLEGDNYRYYNNTGTTKYDKEYAEIGSISRSSTFMQMLLFIFMTIIYFVFGLINKNKTIRNMGIVTLIITSILLITLTWSLGPVYRIITFIGFGIALLIISYLYISKNKKIDIVKTGLFILIMSSMFLSINTHAKVIDIKNWTDMAELNKVEISVSNNNTNTDNQNLYALPINKDIINLSKKNDLSDIRIIDKDKNEIPYIIVKSNQNTQNIRDEKTDVKILENSLTRDNKRILVIDTNREGVLYNNLYLTTGPNSVNFRKKIKVYISDTFLTANSPAWREFEQKNVIYNYTDKDNFTVEKLDINLSGISSRYLKLELIDDIDFDKNIKVNNKLSIQSAQVEYIKGEDKSIGFKVKDYLAGNFVFDNLLVYKDIKLLSNTSKDDKSEIIFEGGIDIESLILKISSDNKNFNRNVVIQGSNDDLDWSIISNANIYRIDSPIYKGEKMNIDIPVSTYKKFKVIIQNNNDKALDVYKTAQVKIQNTGILFKIDNNINISDLKIIVGNNIELSPIYDIKSIINYFENTTPQIIQYQNLIKNPDYKPAKNIIPFGEKNKVFLNIGLIIFIVIIGIFGFFWMRKNNNNQGK